MTDPLLGQLAAKVLVLVAVFTCGSEQNLEQSCWRFGSEQTERERKQPDSSKQQHSPPPHPHPHQAHPACSLASLPKYL